MITNLTSKSTLARVDLGARVQSLAWSRDGRWLAAGTVSGQVFIVSREGERLAELPAQSNPITSVAWDRSSSRLAAACDTNAICIWQPVADAEPSFRLTARLLGHTGNDFGHRMVARPVKRSPPHPSTKPSSSGRLPRTTRCRSRCTAPKAFR
jgi:WD40 repeat protein